MSTALAEMPRPSRRAPAPRPVHVATIRNLTKSYGAIVALRDLNLEVRSGELLALLGPNGAGKTTLVRMLLGVARPDAGSVSVFGADPHGGRVQPRLGAMLQVGRVPETLRVREHIDLFSSYYPAPLPLQETFQIAGIEDIKNRPFGELQVNAAEPVVRELLRRDSWLGDLEVTNAGLEEAFLALTQNNNADHANGRN